MKALTLEVMSVILLLVNTVFSMVSTYVQEKYTMCTFFVSFFIGTLAIISAAIIIGGVLLLGAYTAGLL